MSLIKNIYLSLINWRWELGISEDSLSEFVEKGKELHFHWVKLPFKGRWFADPFILDYNEDEIIILVEEYSDKIKKGRIGKVVVDRKTFTFKSWKLLLELPTHLSFPAIIRRNGKVYIYPENSASGGLHIYEYNPKDDSLRKIQTLLDKPVTDSLYTELFGEKQLFCTEVPNENGNVLQQYSWDENKNMFVHQQDVCFHENIGRRAGEFFELNGHVYSPAQESNVEYGRGMVIQEFTKSNDGEWKVSEVNRIYSPHPTLKLGFHTFNHYKGLTIVDVKGFNHPLIGKILKGIRHIF